MRILVVPVLALLACGADVTTLSDVGTACIAGNLVEVNLGCACAGEVDASCSATVADSQLTVTASATLSGACSDDCSDVIATCEAPDVQGVDVLTYAGRTESLGGAECEGR